MERAKEDGSRNTNSNGEPKKSDGKGKRQKEADRVKNWKSLPGIRAQGKKSKGNGIDLKGQPSIARGTWAERETRTRRTTGQENRKGATQAAI